jgi:DNA-binding transcriptional ArsR family regulator
MDHPPQPDLASVAGLIGQPARAAMLNALLGGQWLTASELARRAGVAAATASEHLARLVDAGLVVRRRSGRHRYHALAGPDVAAALEALGRISAGHATAPRGGLPADGALRFARTCYDHLAGELGVLLTDTLVERGLVAPTGADVTPSGDAWLRDLGIDAQALRATRRTHVRFCLDWSERRDHLAGAVGAAITASLLERRWIVRLDGTRAVRLTPRGRDSLYRALALDVTPTRG